MSLNSDNQKTRKRTTTHVDFEHLLLLLILQLAFYTGTEVINQTLWAEPVTDSKSPRAESKLGPGSFTF